MTKKYKDKEWLERKYIEEKLTIYQMGDLAGCSGVTVLRWMEKYDIKRRSKSEAARLALGSKEHRKKRSELAKKMWRDGTWGTPEWSRKQSEASKRAWKNGAYSGENHPRWSNDAEIVKCDTCGEIMRRRPHRLGWDHYFCSQECRLDFMKRDSKKIDCSWCGQSLYRIKKRIDRNKLGHFCSKECHGAWTSENRRGENAAHWRGGISNKPYPFEFNEAYKERIRERDGRACVLCGITEAENKRKLSVHHTTYDKSDLDPGTKVSLCSSCHAKTNGKRKFWQAVFTEYWGRQPKQDWQREQVIL